MTLVYADITKTAIIHYIRCTVTSSKVRGYTFTCVFVCLQDFSKSCKQISTVFGRLGHRQVTVIRFL